MGLSENRLPPNPIVYHHFLTKSGCVGEYNPIFGQTMFFSATVSPHQCVRKPRLCAATCFLPAAVRNLSPKKRLSLVWSEAGR